jgi:hypothetical protein
MIVPVFPNALAICVAIVRPGTNVSWCRVKLGTPPHAATIIARDMGGVKEIQASGWRPWAIGCQRPEGQVRQLRPDGVCCPALFRNKFKYPNPEIQNGMSLGRGFGGGGGDEVAAGGIEGYRVVHRLNPEAYAEGDPQAEAHRRGVGYQQAL